ncbi:MAG: hypothetical protein CO182_00340 [Lysobacterales bacterium CG_4_9_14_3_um_filter_62_6]|nr:MAG: hypothetical protein CO182_00340 [Xanthomonadales bacterium CG_4_9_14_3_um_filter_62_6]
MTSHRADPDLEIEALQHQHATLIERYRALPAAEPGAHLDTAILKQAALAVQRPPLRRRPWLVPMASAASLVAAAGIGWRVHLANTVEPSAAPRAERYQVLEVELNPPSERQRAVQTTVLPVPAAELPKRVDAPRSAPAAAPKPAPDSLESIVQSPAKDRGIEFEPHTQSDHAGIGQLPEQRVPAAPLAAEEDDLATGPAASPVTAFPAVTNSVQSAAPLPAGKLGKTEASGVGRELGASNGEKADTESAQKLSASEWIGRIRVLIRQRRLHQARKEIRALQIAYPELILPTDIARYQR